MKLRHKFAAIGTVALLAVTSSARAAVDMTAMDTFVSDLTGAGTTLATKLAAVAGGALVLFALYYGIRAAIRMFKTVK